MDKFRRPSSSINLLLSTLKNSKKCIISLRREGGVNLQYLIFGYICGSYTPKGHSKLLTCVLYIINKIFVYEVSMGRRWISTLSPEGHPRNARSARGGEGGGGGHKAQGAARP